MTTATLWKIWILRTTNSSHVLRIIAMEKPVRSPPPSIPCWPVVAIRRSPYCVASLVHRDRFNSLWCSQVGCESPTGHPGTLILLIFPLRKVVFHREQPHQVLRRWKHCSHRDSLRSAHGKPFCLCEPRCLSPITPGPRCMSLLIR